MPYQPGQGKTAVGLFADGLELKMVQLSIKGGRVTLRDFKTVALVKKFEEKQAAASAADEGFAEASAADAFAAAPAAEAATEESNTNASVLLGLLADLPSSKYTVSFALSEPAISYHEFESDFGLSGTKLKKQVIQELSANRPAPPALDALEVIPTASGGILGVIREDGLQLYDLLTELRSFLGGRIPNIKSIESADTALMELVRSSYELQDEEVTVIVYVGHDFSRVIFLQGNNFLHFAPIISEGLGSPNIENTLYSRILLEQDNIALTRIDRILLCGESHKVNLKDALAPQFSSAQVEYIKAPDIDLSMFEGSVGEAISEYAVPLATAWKALNEKQKGFYPINLVPVSILEAQKAFKLAWHGWLAAGLIIVSIVFFYTSILKRHGEIVKAQTELNQKKSRLGELESLRERKAQLNADIQRYSAATALYDEIAPGGDRWSRILHYLANGVEDLNSLWISTIKPGPQDMPGVFIVTGRSIYRTRIPRLANIFEKATLKEVRTITIRKKILYEFDIYVEKVDKGDNPYIPKATKK
jgi:hypothetical protein